MNGNVVSGNVWLTTTELYERHNIPVRLTLAHAQDLQEQGLARRTGISQGGPGSNPWLFNPCVVEFLQGRIGKVGRPRKEEDNNV